MADKRIIAQEEDTSLSAGDYVIVDSQSEGTRKFDLGSELSDIKEDLDNIAASGGVPSTVKEAINTLLHKAMYSESGLTDELALVAAWAQQIESVILNKTSISINGSNTEQLIATTDPLGGTVTWLSSDTNVCTVSDSGLVTGVGNGNATIMAQSGGVKAYCSVVVTGFTMCTINNTLTNVKNSNAAASVVENARYMATISPYYGYELGTVTITMNSVDVTSAVYNDGAIDITSVTGDVVITASATKETNILYAWDFKDSLTDTVEGVTATLSGVELTEGTGVEFTANDPKQYIDLGNVFAQGRYLELYLENVSANITTVNANIIETWDGANDPGTYNAFGWREHNTASYDGWGYICKDVGSWRYIRNIDNRKQNKQLFNGDHKITLEIASSDGLVKIYRDDVDLNLSATPNNDAANDPPHLTTAANAHYPIIGSKLYYPNLFDMTVVGVKIFEGSVA